MNETPRSRRCGHERVGARRRLVDSPFGSKEGSLSSASTGNNPASTTATTTSTAASGQACRLIHSYRAYPRWGASLTAHLRARLPPGGFTPRASATRACARRRHSSDHCLRRGRVAFSGHRTGRASQSIVPFGTVSRCRMSESSMRDGALAAMSATGGVGGDDVAMGWLRPRGDPRLQHGHRGDEDAHRSPSIVVLDCCIDRALGLPLLPRHRRPVPVLRSGGPVSRIPSPDRGDSHAGFAARRLHGGVRSHAAAMGRADLGRRNEGGRVFGVHTRLRARVPRRFPLPSTCLPAPRE